MFANIYFFQLLYSIQMFKLKSEQESKTLGAEVHSLTQRMHRFHSDIPLEDYENLK